MIWNSIHTDVTKRLDITIDMIKIMKDKRLLGAVKLYGCGNNTAINVIGTTLNINDDILVP